MVTLTLAQGVGDRIRSAEDLRRYLDAVATAGFDGVSLNVKELVVGPEQLVEMLAGAGLRCTDLMTLTVTRDAAETLERARAIAPYADATGAKAIGTMMWTRPARELPDRLDELAQVVGRPLALEFGSNALPTLVDAMNLAGAAKPGSARVLADTSHFFRRGSHLEMLDRAAAESIAIVQLADTERMLPPEDYPTETWNLRAMPGEGLLDLGGFRDRLTGYGWDGVVSVEVLSERLRDLSFHDFAARAFAAATRVWSPANA